MVDHRLLDTHQFALIDPLVLEAEEWADLGVVSLAPQGFETKAELLPWLADLSAVSFDRRMTALDGMVQREDLEKPPLFAALLASTEAFSAIHARLKQRLLVRPVPGSLEILRFHDPNVFRHLRWYFGAERLLGWLGIDGWAWHDNGDWHMVQGDERLRHPLAATDEDWAFVHRIEAINTVMRTMQQQGRVLNAPEHGPTIDQLIARAHTHGLEADDAVTFATHGLTVHERFDGHSEVRELLAQCTRPGRYQRLTGPWGAEQWARIKHELIAPESVMARQGAGP